MSDGVTGNTSDFGSEESRFEPWSDNKETIIIYLSCIMAISSSKPFSKSTPREVHQPRVKLFSGSPSEAGIAARVAHYYGHLVGTSAVLGRSVKRTFSDGELYYSYDESIRGHEVYLIQSTPSPAESWIELLIMIDAARRASARYVTAVVPYFGYARQDRKDRPRVSIAGKLMANLLLAAGANRLMTMDLHAGQIQGFFDIPVDHLNSSAIFIPLFGGFDSQKGFARGRICGAGCREFGAYKTICEVFPSGFGGMRQETHTCE